MVVAKLGQIADATSIFGYEKLTNGIEKSLFQGIAGQELS